MFVNFETMNNWDNITKRNELILLYYDAAWTICISKSGILVILNTWSAGIFNIISVPKYVNSFRRAWFLRVSFEKFPRKVIYDWLRKMVAGES